MYQLIKLYFRLFFKNNKGLLIIMWTPCQGQ